MQQNNKLSLENKTINILLFLPIIILFLFISITVLAGLIILFIGLMTAKLIYDRNRAKTFNTKGFAYYHIKDYQKAIENYNQAIAIYKSYYQAYYNRGNVYYELKEYQKALDDYNKAIIINPKYA